VDHPGENSELENINNRLSTHNRRILSKTLFKNLFLVRMARHIRRSQVREDLCAFTERDNFVNQWKTEPADCLVIVGSGKVLISGEVRFVNYGMGFQRCFL
jgi:hypothetical protein